MQYLAQEVTSFTLSNVSEASLDWSAGTSYTVGTLVVHGINVYKCVSAHVGKNPIEFLNIFWVKWAVSNRFAMLDASSQTKSFVSAGNLVVEFMQGSISTIALGNYEASYATIQILGTDSTTVLWSYSTPSTTTSNVTTSSYYSYIYDSYTDTLAQSIKVDLPLRGYKIRVTFVLDTGATRTACGYLYGGVPVSMGQTLFGVSFRYNSFAIKETDSFGTLSIIKRAVQDIIDFETIIASNTLIATRKRVKLVYDTVVLFILDESNTSVYENMLTLGVIESVSTVLANPTITTLTWSIVEGI